MMSDISFGQYYPSDSLLHKLDPRFKIVITILLVVGIFLCNTALSIGFAAVCAVIFMLLSKVPVLTYLKNTKPLIPIIIFTFVLNLIYVPGEHVIFSFWKIE